MADVLFYSCANRGYEDFVGLFAASALWCVPGASVEVGLESAVRFRAENAALCGVLTELFGSQLVFTDVPWKRGGKPLRPHTVRFLTEPKTVKPYVYISDIDIILLDRAFPQAHFDFMQKVGLPYSNSVRPGTKRLSGLHFSRWQALYPLPDVSDLNLELMNDEAVLYEICRRKGLGFHDTWWRPVPGIHVSPHREPKASVNAAGREVPGWGIPLHWQTYLEFRRSDVFKTVAPHFSGQAENAIAAIQAWIQQARPRLQRQKRAARRRLRQAGAG